MFKSMVKLLLLQRKLCILLNFYFALVVVKLARKWDLLVFCISINPRYSIYTVSVKWLLWKLAYCVRL